MMHAFAFAVLLLVPPTKVDLDWHSQQPSTAKAVKSLGCSPAADCPACCCPYCYPACCPDCCLAAKEHAKLIKKADCPPCPMCP